MSALPWKPIAGVAVHQDYSRRPTVLISLTMSIEDAYFIGSALEERHRQTRDDAYLIGERLRGAAEKYHMERLRHA